MALLPQQVGPLTLVRALADDGVCQSWAGILDGPGKVQVSVRQLLPAFAREPAVLQRVRHRLEDLVTLDHASLLPIRDIIEHEGRLFIVQDWVDAVTLADIVQSDTRETGRTLPHNLFLDIAVQICNGLEAMHAMPGLATRTASVLHLGLRPERIQITVDGHVLLGDYGLLGGPTFATQTGGFRLKTAYLAPEQTQSDEEDTDRLQKLTPASNLFALGAVLYELLVLKPMFHDRSPLRTIAKVRRAEVTTQLLEVKEDFQGMDRLLYRALARNPRHRYPRAFVLREDLRRLMAQFSYSDIGNDARAFLAPWFSGKVDAQQNLSPSARPRRRQRCDRPRRRSIWRPSAARPA